VVGMVASPFVPGLRIPLQQFDGCPLAVGHEVFLRSIGTIRRWAVKAPGRPPERGSTPEIRQDRMGPRGSLKRP
jgi:hypothetical protein